MAGDNRVEIERILSEKEEAEILKMQEEAPLHVCGLKLLVFASDAGPRYICSECDAEIISQMAKVAKAMVDKFDKTNSEE